MKFTPIAEIGRSALLERIQKKAVSDHPAVLAGIGTDAAVLRPEVSHDVLFTTEILVEGADFDLTWHPLEHFGFKLVTAGVSDILAMGGLPVAVTIGFALTTKFSVEMVEAIYEGVHSACVFYGCDLAGGDMRSAAHAAVFTVSAVGQVPAGKVITRAKAKPGDAICVTGTVGDALAGLKILLREKKYWQEHPEAESPSLEVWTDAVQRQLLPQARIDIIRKMREHNIRPGAMADLSKGLLNELVDLCKSSKTGAYIYEAALPVSDVTKDIASEMGERAEAYAFQGGDDFQLLFTVSEELTDKMFEVLSDVTIIGMIRPEDEHIRIQKASGQVLEIDED